MKTRCMTMGSILAVLFITLAAGCGGATVDSDTWLVVVGADTLTVGDLGRSWNRMGQRQQQLFIGKDNTVGEYIVSFARKTILEKELEETGYLGSPELISMGESWLRERAGEQYRGLLRDNELRKVSEEEIDFTLSYVGRSAYFTVDPGEDSERSYGPVHIPMLPSDMMMLCDTLETGSTGVTETGIVMRMDSIVMADSALMAAVLADSAALRESARASIGNRNFETALEDLRDSLRSDPAFIVDSGQVARYSQVHAGELEQIDPQTILMSSALGTWTSEVLDSELEYYTSRTSIDPANPEWIVALLDLVHFNAFAFSMLEDEFPHILDSLETEADRYMLDIASDRFYAETVSSSVSVTVEYMQELYETAEPPFTIPEKRALQAVMIPQDSVPLYRRLSQEEREDFIDAMPGFPSLAADARDPQFTIPLSTSEVPGFHGDEVFAMDPQDTVTWLGPLDLHRTDFACLFRLVEVIPERPATFEEVEVQLMHMARNRLEEEVTVTMMNELEAKYGLVMHEEVLSRLPEDPGLWADL